MKPGLLSTISTAGASFTGAAAGPPGRSPSRGGATLDYPVYSAASLDGDLGDGEKILNIASARSGTTRGGLFHALQAVQRGRLCPIFPACFPPLVGPPWACRRLFLCPCPAGRNTPKKQNRRKGHLKARHGVLYPHSYPYIPSPQNGPQRAPHGPARHKATPARSTRSKPGYYHLFRARESTAQRSVVWSYQAQAYLTQFVPIPFGLTGIPLHALTCSAIANSGQHLYSSCSFIASSIVLYPPKSRWYSRFCAISTSSKSVSPGIYDPTVVKVAQESRLLLHHHRPGDPLFKLLLVCDSPHRIVWGKNDLLAIYKSVVILLPPHKGDRI